MSISPRPIWAPIRPSWTRLYLSICSEVDVVAKQLTKKINPEAKAWDIKDYRSVIPARYEHFCEFSGGRPEAGFIADPLEGVADGSEPALVAVLQ